MKNKKHIYIQSIIDKQARKKTEELREHLQDVMHKISNDQIKWLDAVMEDLLPPRLYQAAKRNDLMDEVAAYMQKHGISIVFIPDSLALRIMLGDNVHAQFVPQLTMDGEPLAKTLESSTERN